MKSNSHEVSFPYSLVSSTWKYFRHLCYGQHNIFTVDSLNIATTLYLEHLSILNFLQANFKWAYTCSFQKKILFKLACVLIYSLAKCFLEGFKDSCFENIVISTERYPWRSFFSTKRSTKYNFLGIHEIFNVTNSKILGC